MNMDMTAALANLRFQGVDLLTGGGKKAGGAAAPGASFMDILNAVGGTPFASATGAAGVLGALQTVPSAGSIDQLFGDGSKLLLSAFNYRESTYSKELSRLELMRDKVGGLSDAAKSLQSITPSMSNDEIKAALQDFVQKYNAWDAEFDADVAKGGVLEDSQAANMARFSMQRAVTDIFNGRGNGGLGFGMSELGIEVGKDGQLTFDTAQFDKAMAVDRKAAVTTITNMAYVTARDADSLVAAGNVLSNRIGRLDDALQFIAQNKPAVQSQASQQQVAMTMYQSMMAL